MKPKGTLGPTRPQEGFSAVRRPRHRNSHSDRYVLLRCCSTVPMKRHPHRGIIVAGHPTSLRLEAEFWDFLREIAYERQLSLSG